MPPIRPIGPTAALVLVAVAVGASQRPGIAAPTAEEALALQPRQKNVDYDRPTAAEAAQATLKQEKEGGASALVVRGPSGVVLRAFADTNGNRVVDRWSYYKDGVEVYREIDSDHDTKPDQVRWLNSAGSRWGLDKDANGTLDAWQAISAEETSAEVVAAIRDRDTAAFARLLPTKDDLAAAGFEGALLDDLVRRVERAGPAFAQLASSQKRIGSDAKWASMLTPQPPGVLPAGGPGVAKDVIAYDNVVALVECRESNGQVFVGSLVKCGDAWRPIDAPQVAGEPGAEAEVVGFFTPRLPEGPAAGPGEAVDERLKPLLSRLRDIESKMASAAPDARKELATQQIAGLEQIRTAASDGDRPFWTRQLVETLAAYVQENLLDDGVERLEKLGAAAGDDEQLAAFVAFRLVQARYSAAMEKPDADPEKLQREWFEQLASFVETYPKAGESAEAMLQLAFRDEFEGRDNESIDRYRTIIAGFPDSAQARKAAGAVRRLESVGKPLALSGTTVDGKPLSAASMKGVPVLVQYWSTDCEQCKVDLAQIRELQKKYGPQRFAVVGVALDGDKSRLTEFLKAKPLPWPQLHEPGGLDSRLAEEFGVLALPTMILADASGNVVDRSVSITDLEKKLDAMIGPPK